MLKYFHQTNITMNATASVKHRNTSILMVNAHIFASLIYLFCKILKKGKTNKTKKDAFRRGKQELHAICR